MELKFYHYEFEQEVRERLSIFDRAITDEDAQMVEELDLTNFSFRDEDVDTLFYFSNLKVLGIEMGDNDSCFWNRFPKMEDLYWCCWGFEVDFNMFSNMKNLNTLCVSGGDYSGINYMNLDALQGLKDLKLLDLHEFGTVDIAPLGNMTQLKSFGLRYADRVENIETIGTMTFLEKLCLDGLYVENLDFLDSLPDSIRLEMGGIEICGDEKVDVSKWKRFTNRDICEIRTKEQYWDYIDLTPLEQ